MDGYLMLFSQFFGGKNPERKERASRLVVGVHLGLVLPDHYPSGSVQFREVEILIKAPPYGVQLEILVSYLLCIETTVSSGIGLF